MTPAEEEALVAALRAGDEDAFESVVRTHGPRLLAVARRILRNEDDARDALQEAFISVHRSIGKFEGGSRLGTWLHRIVVNAALMRLRSERRRPVQSIESLLPTFREDGHQTTPSRPWLEAPSLAESLETRDLVRTAIESLPDDSRNILMLRDIEGLDTAETATMLGISKGAVKTRLHRARQALRTQLDPHFRTGAA